MSMRIASGLAVFLAVILVLINSGSVAHATPTSDQLADLYTDLQTPMRYGPLLPSPATWQGNVLVTTGSYTNAQVYSYDGAWYLVAALREQGGGVTTVIFTGSSPLGPWVKPVTALAGSGWDNCVALGSVALAGSTWGSGAVQGVNDAYYMSYFGNSACNNLDTAEGMAWAPSPAAGNWTRGNSPVLSPVDATATAYDDSAFYRASIIAAPAGGYVMFATTEGEEGIAQISSYSSADLLNWRRFQAPVVSPEGTYLQRLAADAQTFQHPDSGLWVMVYRLTDSNGTVDSFAATDDETLAAWTTYSSVSSPASYALMQPRAQTTSFGATNYVYDNAAASRPWLFRDGGITYHFYDSQYAGNPNSLPAVAVDSLVANSSFEESTSAPLYWSTYCGATGGDCDASYVDAADGQSGANELTHCKEADYDVATYQDISNLSNGSYSLSAWVISSGNQYSVSMTVSGYGGETYTIPIGTSTAWQLLNVPMIPVTSGGMTVTFASHGRAGSFLHVDDVLLQPVGLNFSFDIAGYPSQDVAGWVSVCTLPGGLPCPVDYVEEGGRTGLRLTHSYETAYTAATLQTLTVPNGIYSASVWVLTPGGCGTVGGSKNAASAYLQVQDYGGQTLQQGFTESTAWQQVIIPNVQVTQGSVTLALVSDCGPGTSRSFDDVQFSQ